MLVLELQRDGRRAFLAVFGPFVYVVADQAFGLFEVRGGPDVQHPGERVQQSRLSRADRAVDHGHVALGFRCELKLVRAEELTEVL